MTNEFPAASFMSSYMAPNWRMIFFMRSIKRFMPLDILEPDRWKPHFCNSSRTDFIFSTGYDQCNTPRIALFSNMSVKNAYSSRAIRVTKGGLNSKLHISINQNRSDMTIYIRRTDSDTQQEVGAVVGFVGYKGAHLPIGALKKTGSDRPLFEQNIMAYTPTQKGQNK